MINNQKTDFTNEVSFKKVVASETIYGEWDATNKYFVLDKGITEGLWAIDTWFVDSEGDITDDDKMSTVAYIYDHTSNFSFPKVTENSSHVISTNIGWGQFKDTGCKHLSWNNTTNTTFTNTLIVRCRRIG